MPSAAVLAPAPQLTVTVEAGSGSDEIHLHAGGQGLWQARMLADLGVGVTVVGHFAGEVGAVVRSIVAERGVKVASAHVVNGSNGSYLHDRRNGERIAVAEMSATPLSRHEADDLYGQILVEALEADVTVLGGPGTEDIIPSGFYRRLARDLRVAGRTVVVDLSGASLLEVGESGATVLKVAHDELVEDGLVEDDGPDALAAFARDWVQRDFDTVVVTRAGEPAIACSGERLLLVHGPAFDPVESRGAGDSFTAAFAAVLASGGTVRRALSTGAAAGALNVTRHGLAAGDRDRILRLADHIEVEEWAGGSA